MSVGHFDQTTTRQLRLASRSSFLLPGVIVTFAALAALVTGLLASFGSVPLLFPLAAGGAFFVALLSPLRWLTWALFVSAFLIVGPAIYFLRIENARWLAPGLGLLLLLPYLVRLVVRREAPRTSQLVPGSVVLYVCFLLVLAFSTLISAPQLGELIQASRMYVAYLPLALLVLAGFLSPQDQLRLWKFLMICAVMQFPVALYQILFIAPQRELQRALWDAVTGTFPGNPEGGGANAAVSLFVLIASLIAISMWRAGFLRRWQMLIVASSSLFVVMMGEVKAIAFLIPLAVGVLFAKDLVRRPVLAVGGLILGIVLGVAVLTVYQRVHFADRDPTSLRADMPLTPMESIRNQLDPELPLRGANASRAYTLIDWARRNLRGEHVVQALVGYGAASTQIGRLGVGEVANFLTYRAGMTASGLLLWDAGIVGHVLVAASFAAAAVMGFRLLRSDRIPPVHRAVMHAVAVGVLLYLVCLPYNQFMFNTAPAQVLLFFSLGYIGYWQRIASGRSGRHARVGSS